MQDPVEGSLIFTTKCDHLLVVDIGLLRCTIWHDKIVYKIWCTPYAMFAHNIACYVILINEEFVELSTKNTYKDCINLFEDPNYVNVICKFSINKFVSQVSTL